MCVFVFVYAFAYNIYPCKCMYICLNAYIDMCNSVIDIFESEYIHIYIFSYLYLFKSVVYACNGISVF